MTRHVDFGDAPRGYLTRRVEIWKNLRATWKSEKVLRAKTPSGAFIPLDTTKYKFLFGASLQQDLIPAGASFQPDLITPGA